MAIPEDMMYVRYRFKLLGLTGEEVEEAVFGFHGHRHHTVGNDVDWATDIQGVAESARDKLVTAWTDIAPAFTNRVVGDRVDAYHLDTAGKTLDKGSASFTGDDAIEGSVSAGTLPYQCALVLSMYSYPHGSFVPHGKSRRGRIFLPPPAGSFCGNDGRAQTTKRDALLTAMQAFFNDIQGMHIGDDGGLPTTADYFELALLSKVRGEWYQIVDLGLGLVIDTQRSRRRSLNEARTWASIDVS